MDWIFVVGIDTWFRIITPVAGSLFRSKPPFGPTTTTINAIASFQILMVRAFVGPSL